jgi:hypothetical protein
MLAALKLAPQNDSESDDDNITSGISSSSTRRSLETSFISCIRLQMACGRMARYDRAASD